MTEHLEAIYPYPEIKSLFLNLVKEGRTETSSHPFVREVKEVEIEEVQDPVLKAARRCIQWQKRNKGIGYISSSPRHDRGKEVLIAAYIASAFAKREIETTPLIVPIDDFYKFLPGILSLVAKTRAFERVRKRMFPQENFALILTDFSDSRVFTQEILDQVPNQDNAGLELLERSSFGERLIEFAQNLGGIFEQQRGDLNAVLKIIGKGKETEETRLLLATGLLLQDKQIWQGLWYERKEEGTSLYIVAPLSFHDAMNRLNLGWGHGGIDYRNRASLSLGDWDKPPFEKVELTKYHQQGLPFEEFKRKIEPYL